ncbi:hypothetical protein ACFSC6_13105 [Rufibacter sediminis]|uniref:Right handed beta helix domain-containing protein n=1 Tax=Rufibacter sediminis TaxID=2762756 RepID=A0ABR6VTC6_9BACT|nr:hypothetical protein [Rufibacter sediminis]MBC3540401.1 hypothetical protein [Rufibacter sediminis]
MKQLLLLSGLLLGFFSTHTVVAKIWRLNNNPGTTTGDFKALQEAHDAASTGDTLYLEGSPNHYGSLSSSKKLIIIGPGYYLAENSISNINTASALVQGIVLSDGAQGSEIIGLDFFGNSVDIRTSDIFIRRNKFNNNSGDSNLEQLIWGTGRIYLNSSTANNIFITQNFGLEIHGPSYANTGILITNNLIASPGYYGEDNTQLSVNINAFTMAVFQNNIFLRGTVSSHRASFTNNIMVKGFFEERENMASNNLGNAAQFGTADGNKSNIDMSTVFNGTDSPDDRWRLKAGSPAIGAGYGSTSAKPVDAGMFWGNTPYRISGLPGIPVIYFINVQSVGSNTDPIDVTVKVRSTN